MIPPVERRVVDGVTWPARQFVAMADAEAAKEFAEHQAWWSGFWWGWCASLAAVLSGCLFALWVLA